MDLAKRFLEYAGAFEQTYTDNDWTRLDPFFTSDAIYTSDGGPPLSGRAEGKQQVLDQMRGSVDGLDRKFDKRSVALIGAPKIGDDTFEIRWRATYEKDGCPDLVFEGSERATFEGECIRLLEDDIEEGADQRIQDYMERHFDGPATGQLAR